MTNTTNISKKIPVCLAVTFAVIGLLFSLTAEPSFATSVTIGQATCDENNNLKGGRSGDQDGNEVSTSSWNSSNPGGFDYIIRAKDPVLAKKMAKNMIAACENDHIGYDQGWPARKSAYWEAENAGWDISAIETDCETTCSEVVNMCMRAAGVEKQYAPDNYLATDSLWENVESSGQFEKVDNISSATILAGDILINEGTHTAMVIESPNLFEFKVTYTDIHGKKQVKSYEEGTVIQLNSNNGKEIRSIKIEENIDLSAHAPQKKGFTFAGWDVSEDGSFAAKYMPSVMAIRVNCPSHRLTR